MVEKRTRSITQEEVGQRLDRVLRSWYPQLSFAALQKLFRTGQIRLNGGRVKGSERLEIGQEVRLPPQLAQYENASEDAIVFTEKEKAWVATVVLYEDEDIVAINKPAGMPSQAGSGHEKSLDRLMEACYAPKTPKLVHRLDKATTGVLVFAFNRASAANLSYFFAQRQTEKTYLALVKGTPLDHEGIIDFNLEKTRDFDGLERVHVRKKGEEGQQALTVYKCLKRYKNGLQLVEVKPQTGRMHQIRAHFSALGCPIVGDKKYGGETCAYKGKGAMLLHAYQLHMPHPRTEEMLTLSAPLPPVFDFYLQSIAGIGK